MDNTEAKRRLVTAANRYVANPRLEEKKVALHEILELISSGAISLEEAQYLLGGADGEHKGRKKEKNE